MLRTGGEGSISECVGGCGAVIRPVNSGCRRNAPACSAMLRLRYRGGCCCCAWLRAAGVVVLAGAAAAWGGLAGLRGPAPPAHALPQLQRSPRYVLYPEGSLMGLFLAMAIPLDLPNKDVSVSWNFEANYELPYNATELAAGPTLGRSGRSLAPPFGLDRRRAYRLLEAKLDSERLPGRECLLRAVCEAAETPLRHNGLLGDLLHVVLTPSCSEDEGLPAEFAAAEAGGAAGADCALQHADCPASVLGMVSELL